MWFLLWKFCDPFLTLSPPRENKKKVTARRIVEVDPGARIPLVRCNKSKFSKFSLKNDYYETKELFWSKYLKKKTEKFEKTFVENVKNVKPNMKDGREYRNNIDFCLAWFEDGKFTF
jgi:hypothetical protein